MAKINPKKLAESLSAANADELYNRRELMLAELSYVEEEIQRRATQRRIHVKAGDQHWRVDPGSGCKTWMIISPEGGFDIHNFMTFMLEIPPHFSSGKYHVHGDAVKHYLSGRGKEMVGDQVFDVGPGDFIHIPAGVWHGTENPYDEPIRILGTQIRPGAPLQIPVSHIGAGFLEE